MAKEFAITATVSSAHRRLARQWLAWGLIGTVPLVSALYFMIFKPGEWLIGHRMQIAGLFSRFIPLFSLEHT